MMSQPPGRKTRAASRTIRGVNFQAGGAGEERDVRLPVADFALQARSVAQRHVGRVGNDQIHRGAGEGGHQVAGDEL